MSGLLRRPLCLSWVVYYDLDLLLLIAYTNTYHTLFPFSLFSRIQHFLFLSLCTIEFSR